MSSAVCKQFACTSLAPKREHVVQALQISFQVSQCSMLSVASCTSALAPSLSTVRVVTPHSHGIVVNLVDNTKTLVH